MTAEQMRTFRAAVRARREVSTKNAGSGTVHSEAIAACKLAFGIAIAEDARWDQKAYWKSADRHKRCWPRLNAAIKYWSEQP